MKSLILFSWMVQTIQSLAFSDRSFYFPTNLMFQFQYFYNVGDSTRCAVEFLIGLQVFKTQISLRKATYLAEFRVLYTKAAFIALIAMDLVFRTGVLI